MELGKIHNYQPQLHVHVAMGVTGTAPPRVKIHAVGGARTTVVLNAKVVKMVVPLVVVEDVMEVAIRRVNQLVRGVPLVVVEDAMEVVILHAKDVMGNAKAHAKKDATVLVIQDVQTIAKQDVIQLALDHVQLIALGEVEHTQGVGSQSRDRMDEILSL